MFMAFKVKSIYYELSVGIKSRLTAHAIQCCFASIIIYYNLRRSLESWQQYLMQQRWSFSMVHCLKANDAFTIHAQKKQNTMRQPSSCIFGFKAYIVNSRISLLFRSGNISLNRELRKISPRFIWRVLHMRKWFRLYGNALGWIVSSLTQTTLYKCDRKECFAHCKVHSSNLVTCD